MHFFKSQNKFEMQHYKCGSINKKITIYKGNLFWNFGSVVKSAYYFFEEIDYIPFHKFNQFVAGWNWRFSENIKFIYRSSISTSMRCLLRHWRVPTPLYQLRTSATPTKNSSTKLMRKGRPNWKSSLRFVLSINN